MFAFLENLFFKTSFAYLCLGSMMHIGIHSTTAQYFSVLMLLMFIVGFAMSAGSF